MRHRRFGLLARPYRNLGRYRQILTVLAKYGFDSLLDRLHIGSYIETNLPSLAAKRPAPLDALSDSARLRMALEELGPTFVKLGQILSTRPDLVPVPLIRELAKLQDQVPAFAFAQVQDILEEDLPAPPAETFARFQETPLAAASIGQVHRAVLQTGEEVIVKIRRPGIRETVAVDLEILYDLARLAERHLEEAAYYRPTTMVDEFARTLLKELDYRQEALHAERFRRLFQDNPAIRIPRVFPDLCTDRVLTMEYVAGIKASEAARLDEAGLDRRIIASRGANLLLEQVFVHGFFHADPHPGNLSILPGNVICYLDFGMVGHVDRKSREVFAEMIIGYGERDAARITEAVLKIVEWDREPDRRALERDMARFMEGHLYKPLREVHLGDLLQEFMDLVAGHRLRLPPDIFLMIKALAEMEGIGRILDPEFDMAEKVSPFVARLALERRDPRRLLADALDSGRTVLDLLKRIRQGEMRIGVDHRGLEPLLAGIERLSRQLFFGLLMAALLVGSSLILAAGAGPLLFGLPGLAIAGYVLAAVLGGWLFLLLRRSKRP